MTDSYEIQNSVIEWLRDEELCRKWYALADEKHTHHLTPQEYYNFKSIWWLRSIEIDFNTVPVERRPDFKPALSTLQQLKEQEEEARRNQQWAQSSSSWWNWQGSWWTPYSYESQHGDEPSTDRTGWLVIQVFGNNSSGHDFLEFIYFVADVLFTADGGLL